LLPPSSPRLAAKRVRSRDAIVKNKEVVNRSTTWPHAPDHRLSENGTYYITAATLQKQYHLSTRERLDWAVNEFLERSAAYGWTIEAWAFFSNHYHFVIKSEGSKGSRTQFFKHLHGNLSRYLNKLDHTPGRKCWYNFWDTKLTFEKSYLARLNYTHQNAVKHGLVHKASLYPWCSAGWFESTASSAQVKTIYSFDFEKVKVEDAYEVSLPEDM
jgi:putative transposase